VIELSPNAARYLADASHGTLCSADEHSECGLLGVDGVPVWTCDFSLEEAACKAARMCSCGLDDLRRAIRG
jgi:hypothetical protein